MTMPTLDPVTKYALDVVEGRIVAGRLVRLACERHLRDLERQGTDEFPWVFDPARAERVFQFYTFCRHVKGPKAGEPIILEPWQKFILGSIFGWVHRETGLRRFRKAYVQVARGNGKALALDTPIPTVDGWKTMADIHPGDVVFDENGQPCRVVAVGPIQYGRPCYRVRFSDGEEIIADAEHEWLTTAKVDSPGKKVGRRMRRWSYPKLVRRTIGGREYFYARLYGRLVYLGPANRAKEAALEFKRLAREDLQRHPFGEDTKTRIRTTEEIRRTLAYGSRGDLNHTVPIAGALQLPERDLPIPPYTLGAWLGDGHSAGARITCADPEIIAEIQAEGVPVKPSTRRHLYYLSDGDRSSSARGLSLQSKLRELGLLNNKHIPQFYLRASERQRLSLLQGLMDTDGYVSNSGQCEFSTTIPALRDGVSELLASLGIKHTIVEHRSKVNGKDCGPVWRVQFWPSKDKPVFRLPRKLARLRERRMRNGPSASRTIVSVEPVPSVPVRCIQVSSPSALYLAGRRMVPTHNSTLLSGLGLYMLMADGEAGAEIYATATKRDQARIVYDAARMMAIRSPDLLKRLEPGKAEMLHPASGGKFAPLSKDTKSLDGLNPHLGIIDEYHAHPTREMYDLLVSAMGKRLQPLLFIITTAGFDLAYPCYEEYQYLVKMLEGELENEQYFAYIAQLDQDDNPQDESCWIKANPLLAATEPGMEYLRKQLQEALDKPSEMRSFLTKNLNMWVEQREEGYMPMDKWRACAASKDNPMPDLDGRACYIGVDLSSKIDMTSVAIEFPLGSGRYAVLTHSFIPEDRLRERLKTDKQPYDAWARLGWLTVIPGAVVDQQAIIDWIEAKVAEHGWQVREICVDPWNATQFSIELQKRGYTVVEITQGIRTLSEPTKDFRERVFRGEIIHDGSPVLTWAMGNAVERSDHNGNIMLDKAKSRERIDPVAALINAHARAMHHESESAYDPNRYATDEILERLWG